MVRPVPIALMLLIGLALVAQGEVLSNERFCGRGIETMADTLVSRLQLERGRDVTLVTIGGRFGELLMHQLSTKLGQLGITTYLGGSAGAPDRPSMRAEISDCRLSYASANARLFSRGKILREFRIGGYCRLLQSDGRLLQSILLNSLVVSDTLSYDDARLARGSDRFLSPDLPPTVYQRLVEPGLIIGITGTLVYLFFASR